MFKLNLKLGLALGAMTLMLSGCSFTLNSNQGVESNLPDGGIYVSTNRGDTWKQMATVPIISGTKSLVYTDVSSLVMDPSDSRAVYFGARDLGLYYTYNIAEGWREDAMFAKVTVNDIKVDPKDKCTIYVAAGNKLFRSTDCSRSFEQIYFDNNTGVTLNSIVIDQYNPKNIYLGTSRGEIIKSVDSGASWRTIQRLINEGVNELVINPLDSRQFFIASTKSNIFSFNSGTNTNASTTTTTADIEKNFSVDNWLALTDILKSSGLKGSFKELLFCPADPKIFIATDKTLLRSSDNGLTWENINLIPSEKDAVINDIVVNPKNCGEIYYVTNTTFYRSLDGGVTWTTRKLPTTRAGWKMLIDWSNGNTLYLGTKKLEQSNSIQQPK
ncbi:MAG: hypothetical protein NTX66_04640 [Candidatus Falkowbacteria bacterium]|nr:hypothetical protein [Candidatus Falkowbacteria bacterium]